MKIQLYSYSLAVETATRSLKDYVIVLCALSVLASAMLGIGSRQQKAIINSYVASSSIVSREALDRDLSIAAASALGNREGTVIVMDPRTGRVRAVSNPQLAFEKAFAPGSTIKPFSTLAALRSGMIEKDSRLICREHFSHEDFKTVCSHPTNLPPLKPAEALAYSCNYYFGKLGEQMRDSTFNSTLAEFGFGKPTKINQTGAREAAGKLPQGRWQVETALGEGAQLQVTPIQLLTAYSALVNGGNLFVPKIAPEEGFVAQYHTELTIEDAHRQLILAGMRGAVRYGTAERAKFHSLPLHIVGKTGTATQIGGFRTHGWFVGLASRIAESPSAPADASLAVLVFLKRAHGADAAEIARPIFEAYVQATNRVNGEMDPETTDSTGMQPSGPGYLAGQEGWFTPADFHRQLGGGEPPFLTCEFMQPERFGESNCPQRRNHLRSDVRIHLARENLTRVVPLEDYVLGVVAAEGSTETEAEALKALAVASRTYALKNLRRHGVDGYDFCTSTHCQRYLSKDRRASSSPISLAVSEAVRQTAGRVLQDNDGRIVDSYFSASCGGATADIGTLWGLKAPSHLTSNSDEYCLTMPHHTWIDMISSTDLLRAMESDPRTKVGGTLTNVEVARRDASGRAELITIDGARRRTVKGWDFKIIVGRELGWNLLKSSRFEISRSRSNYIFRGSGFGHGLGLCQEGAHVMARRGASYQQILAKYFPGTRVGKGGEMGRWGHGERGRGGEGETGRRGDGERGRWGEGEMEPWSDGRAQRHSVRSHHAVPKRRTLTSEHFRLSYPARLSQADAEHVLKVLESSRSDLIRRVSTGGVSFPVAKFEVFVNDRTGDFVARTGQPAWVAAATLQKRIELQPIELLRRRRVLETTLRHELVHAVIDLVADGRTPRWLSEGLALHFAGEGLLVVGNQDNTEIAVSDLEQRLSRPASAAEMQASYAAAYREVRRLIRAEGESTVWHRATHPS